MKGIFHIHTNYSFDTYTPVSKIISWLQNLGINFAAITDHETIQGALEAKRISKNSSLQIIVGAEYLTEKGDIMGLFLEKEIKTKESKKVIQEIKAQNGIVVLPHPYKAHKLDPELINSVDVIEVYNARTSDARNNKALELAKKYKKPMIAGSDAHFLSEIELTQMQFEGVGKNCDIECLKRAIILGKGKIIRREETYFLYPMISGLTKLYKTKDPRIIWGWLKKIPSLIFYK
jgi:hypothetical protein